LFLKKIKYERHVHASVVVHISNKYG